MSEDNVRFGLTQKAYELMYKVAMGEFVSYEECFIADRLWQIERRLYIYLEKVRVGPPSCMREYNMLLKDGYITHYVDGFADFMEKQFRTEKTTLVPTMPVIELTEAGKKKKEEMESNPTAPPDPWGSWLYKLEEDEFEVPPWITRGLEKIGWIKIVSKPIDHMRRDEEWESQLF